MIMRLTNVCLNSKFNCLRLHWVHVEPALCSCLLSTTNHKSNRILKKTINSLEMSSNKSGIKNWNKQPMFMNIQSEPVGHKSRQCFGSTDKDNPTGRFRANFAWKHSTLVVYIWISASNEKKPRKSKNRQPCSRKTVYTLHQAVANKNNSN